ncbi:MAG: hypothetical protein QXZ41_02510 [Ignisphaera sp.]|uniref:P-type ATPase A domain-containing protein n=1 Tax=Ignisphaera aggregans TaxID=334771 RepID=A0A832CPT0_9CREN
MLESKPRVVVKVLWNNRWIDVNPENIVPDDIVNISMEDMMSADDVVIKGSVSVDESALT